MDRETLLRKTHCSLT